MTEIVAAGYVAVRPTARPEWAGFADAFVHLPDPMISLDESLSPHMPSLTWACDWDEEAERFGVTVERRADAREWIAAHDGHGGDMPDIFYTDVSRSPAVVTEFVQRFAPMSGARILGYGLRAPDVDAFLARHARELNQRDGIIEMLERREPMAPGGRVLGYEPCEANFGGITTSWTVNHLPPNVQRATGVRVNGEGLVDPADVDVVDAWIQATPAKEPGIWRAWAVTEYPR